ncbi:MAG: hypothetical protein B7C24_05290 [Bacteroidetes bacterium 4572_77]|nr:MAG: hypothetical protein B7C24_05290 [Bacteroidetes bacterium 4572_77]
MKIMLIILGSLSLALGIIGIFLPLLPTTPFLLLSAFFYSKSSPVFYNKLVNNTILGPYIKTYLNGNGIPLKTKIIALLFLWATLISSMYIFRDTLIISIILIFVGIGVSTHIIMIKTYKKRDLK